MIGLLERITGRPFLFGGALVPAPATGKVSLFLLETVYPMIGSDTPLDLLATAYRPWCAARGDHPLGRRAVLREMARLFDKAGVRLVHRHGRVFAVSVGMAEDRE